MHHLNKKETKKSLYQLLKLLILYLCTKSAALLYCKKGTCVGEVSILPAQSEIKISACSTVADGGSHCRTHALHCRTHYPIVFR